MLVDVRPGLVKLLTSNPQIMAIVAGGGITRIFPVLMRQGETRDSIVYTRITEIEDYKMDGPTALVSARFQFDAWSLSNDNANTLANLVKETLGGFSGRIFYDATNYVVFQLIELINGRDDFDTTSLMYRMSRDFYVWFDERNG